MKSHVRYHGTLTCAVIPAVVLLACANSGRAVTLQYAGSHENIGGTFFPGGGPADVQSYVVVPWRTSSANNTFAVSTEPLQQYYGSAGYALFATTFTYPNANLYGGEPAIDPGFGDPLFPNMIDLPDWVAESQILATRMAGGYPYSLIDDPVLTHGYRDYNWGDSQSPPANPPHSQAPYVKMGFLDGNDLLGNNPTSSVTGRWGFIVGPDVPPAFRVGVMTGGMDSSNFAPSEVFIQQYDNLVPVGDPLGTGTLTGGLRDRFVDMHFFDIIGAQEGQQFAFGVTAGDGSFGNAGVAGFSFDVLPNVVMDNADFDDDGDIDGRDYLIWQAGFGSGTSNAEGDANGDGMVDAEDLTIWQSQFGNASLVSTVQVPEPQSLVLLLCATWLWRCRRRSYV